MTDSNLQVDGTDEDIAELQRFLSGAARDVAQGHKPRILSNIKGPSLAAAMLMASVSAHANPAYTMQSAQQSVNNVQSVVSQANSASYTMKQLGNLRGPYAIGTALSAVSSLLGYGSNIMHEVMPRQQPVQRQEPSSAPEQGRVEGFDESGPHY